MKISNREILEFINILIKRTEEGDIEWVTELDYSFQSDLMYEATTNTKIDDDKTVAITLIRTRTDQPVSFGTNLNMESVYTIKIVILDNENNELEEFSDFNTILMPDLLYAPLEKLYNEIRKSAVREVEIDQTPGITSFIRSYVENFK